MTSLYITWIAPQHICRGLQFTCTKPPQKAPARRPTFMIKLCSWHRPCLHSSPHVLYSASPWASSSVLCAHAATCDLLGYGIYNSQANHAKDSARFQHQSCWHMIEGLSIRAWAYSGSSNTHLHCNNNKSGTPCAWQENRYQLRLVRNPALSRQSANSSSEYSASDAVAVRNPVEYYRTTKHQTCNSIPSLLSPSHKSRSQCLSSLLRVDTSSCDSHSFIATVCSRRLSGLLIRLIPHSVAPRDQIPLLLWCSCRFVNILQGRPGITSAYFWHTKE